MITYLVAGVCMVAQDSLAVLKVQSQNRSHAVLAWLFDNGTWLTSTIGVTIAAFTFHSRNHAAIAALIGVILLANLAGNLLGVWMGKRLVKDTVNLEQDSEIATLTARVKALEDRA